MFHIKIRYTFTRPNTNMHFWSEEKDPRYSFLKENSIKIHRDEGITGSVDSYPDELTQIREYISPDSETWLRARQKFLDFLEINDLMYARAEWFQKNGHTMKVEMFDQTGTLIAANDIH